MQFELIVSIVKEDYTNRVIAAAKKCGVRGSTIIPARGTGVSEAKTFFGLNLEASSDVILLLVETHLTDTLLKAIHKAGDFGKPGTGIAFVLPAERVIGMERQMRYFKSIREKMGEEP